MHIFYLLGFKRYQVEINEITKYYMHPKKLISELLPNMQFVRSLCKKMNLTTLSCQQQLAKPRKCSLC